MRPKFVTIGQNLKWPRERLSLARKKSTNGIYDSRFSSSKMQNAISSSANRIKAYFSKKLAGVKDSS